MLQQTQVARVLPRYESFLARFPTLAACAAAPAGDVVALWKGLGYNRRALNLHRCAVAVMEQHGGSLPLELEALLDLPGIGPYTARAVLAFAGERDVGVVDTNAARVLARWEGRPLSAREVQHAADQAVPAGGGWAWNQSLLDLGALVCDKRTPQCERCPVPAWCAWAAAGRPHPDPADGTAGASGRQSAFAGSDRQGRGRLVAALTEGPVAAAPAGLAVVMGWPGDVARAEQVAAAVVADGLAVRDGNLLRLP